MCYLSHFKNVSRHEPHSRTACAKARERSTQQGMKLGEGGQGGLMGEKGGHLQMGRCRGTRAAAAPNQSQREEPGNLDLQPGLQRFCHFEIL